MFYAVHVHQRQELKCINRFFTVKDSKGVTEVLYTFKSFDLNPCVDYRIFCINESSLVDVTDDFPLPLDLFGPVGAET